VQGNRRLGGLEEDICCVYLVCELYFSIAEMGRNAQGKLSG